MSNALGSTVKSSEKMGASRLPPPWMWDLRSSGVNAAYSGNSLPTFRDSLSVPSSRVKKSKKDVLTLEDGTDRLFQRSVRNYHYSLRNKPRWAQILREKMFAGYIINNTYSMVQSPSWEAKWFAASQEIPRISRNPKVHYRTHKRPPPVYPGPAKSSPYTHILPPGDPS